MANSKKNIKKVTPAKKNTPAIVSSGSKRQTIKAQVKSTEQNELFEDNLSNTDNIATKNPTAVISSSSKRQVTKAQVKSKEQNDLFEVNLTNTENILTKNNIENLLKSQTLDFTKPIYIQINVNNIYNIFASGLVSAQYDEKIQNYVDIQSINPTFLILSNGYIGRNEESDILLEIDLKESETTNFETKNGVLLHSGPFPISRIKKILVSSDLIKKDISNNALLGDAGFIPSDLFSLKDEVKELYEIPTIHNQAKPIDQSLYKKFDKILGTFAYLANYNILVANRSNSIKTLPDHFFLAAKAINNTFESTIDNERVLTFYKILFGQNENEQPLLQWLVSRISEGSNFTNEDISKFSNVLKECASSDFVRESDEVLKLLQSPLGRKDVIKEIPNLKHSEKFYLYLFAILRQYGNSNTEDKSISRADLPDFIFPSYGQYTFAFLGYFYGYKSLRNFEDKINIADLFFTDSLDLGKRINLKFKLDTAFDLALIESAYQYVFNSKTESDILDYNKYPQISQTKSRAIILDKKPYKVDYQNFLGKQIYNIEKADLISEVDKLLENVSIIPAISIFGATCYRNQVKISSKSILELSSSALNYYLYFRKEDILSTIKQGKLKSEDAIKDILLSLKENEF